MTSFIQSNQTVTLRDIAQTISEADSGKIMLLPTLSTAPRVMTLPAAKQGLHYRFVVTVAGLGQIARITAPTGIIGGVVQNTNGVGSTVIAKNGASVDLTATATIGDFLDVYCDGTNWSCQGLSGVVAGLA